MNFHWGRHTDIFDGIGEFVGELNVAAAGKWANNRSDKFNTEPTFRSKLFAKRNLISMRCPNFRRRHYNFWSSDRTSKKNIRLRRLTTKCKNTPSIIEKVFGGRQSGESTRRRSLSRLKAFETKFLWGSLHRTEIVHKFITFSSHHRKSHKKKDLFFPPSVPTAIASTRSLCATQLRS